MYAAGLLSDLKRKSVEPIAALASNGSPKRCALYHHRRLHLLSTSPWNDEDVRAYAADYALRALTKDEPIEAWSIDDTGFLKQGDDSVGVQRQHTGSAGKITKLPGRRQPDRRHAHGAPAGGHGSVPARRLGRGRRAANGRQDPGHGRLSDEARHCTRLDRQGALGRRAARPSARRQRVRLVRALARRGDRAQLALCARCPLVARRAARRRGGATSPAGLAAPQALA
jgi:hypothetical protein